VRKLLLGVAVLAWGGMLAAQEPDKPGVKLLEVAKIWDRAPHNAFTDLIRYKSQWFCAFREGDGHARGAGVIRLLRMVGDKWESAGVIEEKGIDLRDPKLSVTPDGRLMLVGGAAVPASRDPVTDHYSFVCFSKDGQQWTKPHRALDTFHWLWRVTWHEGAAYGVAYSWDPRAPREDKKRTAALYRSKDGLKWEKVTDFKLANPSEATLRFDGDTMVCLQRRDGAPNTAQLGTSAPPYTEWKWQDLGVYFGGPNMIRTEDGKGWLAVGRLILDGKAQTVLCRLTPEKGLERLLTLPSGGDNSYAGLVLYQGDLWISYYSSHEGKSSIYLAKVKL
jgi:hypothetical protein